MKKITLIITLIVALIAAPTMAATSAPEMRGFIKNDGSIIVVSHFDAGSTSNAKAMVRMTDDALVEDSFDAMVADSQTMSTSALDGIGADSGKLYGVVMLEAMQPALIVVASTGDTVYMLVYQSDDLDTDMFAMLTYDVMHDGMDIDAPRGFIEVPMDDMPIDAEMGI